MEIQLKDHEYWYYFGKCTPYPKQIKSGMLLRPPYKRFETKEECWEYINSNKTFDPYTELITIARNNE